MTTRQTLTAIMISLAVANAMASVGDPVNLVCKPTQPCLYFDDGLNSCVSEVVITGREGGRGSVTVYFHLRTVISAATSRSQASDILIGTKPGIISFQDSTGDQWGDLQSDSRGQKYQGKIIVDQDFEFAVNCANKAFGLE